MNLDFLINSSLIAGVLGPLIVGFVIWSLGERAIDKRLKQEAIRDLMTFRGDYASQNFRESLNRVSITFHKTEEIRNDVRHLYDVINNPSSQQKTIERTIIGLIYKLCQQNGFTGLTEYDIDQSFILPQQTPTETLSKPESVTQSTSALKTKKSNKNNKKSNLTS
jgi:hypothetical protein